MRFAHAVPCGNNLPDLQAFECRRSEPFATAEEALPTSWTANVLKRKTTTEVLQTLISGLGIELGIFGIRGFMPEKRSQSRPET